MMLPMMMMGGMGGESGSKGGGTDGGQMEMLLRLMAPQLFQEDTVEAVANDLIGFGTARDRSGDATIGILEFMVLPPHKLDPKARLRIKTNGPVFATPDELMVMAEAMMRIAKSGKLKDAYLKEKENEAEAAAEAQQANMMRGLAKSG